MNRLLEIPPSKKDKVASAAGCIRVAFEYVCWICSFTLEAKRMSAQLQCPSADTTGKVQLSIEVPFWRIDSMQLHQVDQTSRNCSRNSCRPDVVDAARSQNVEIIRKVKESLELRM